MSANSRQVGGQHYRSKYQHWDFAHKAFGDAYFQGQITKYVYRWRKKNGLEDLNKAAHFLQKLIELREADLLHAWPSVRAWWREQMLAVTAGERRTAALELIAENGVGAQESRVILAVADGRLDRLYDAASTLSRVIWSVSTGEDATSHYVDQDHG